MKKFSQYAKFRKINEQEITLQGNQEEQNKDGVQVQVQVQGQDPTKTEKPTEPEQKSDPAKFFSKLFESREMAHVYHLQVKGDMGSFAAHTALGEYYNSVLELIDELIETYQGQYDIITGYDSIDTSATSSKDKLEYFKELVQSVIQNRYVMLSKDDTHLQNVVDEVIGLIFRLLYKLRFNK
jgi:hypothetical protein